MRMRLKKHLNERLAKCADLLVAREGDDFYRLSEGEKSQLAPDLREIFGNAHPLVLEIGCGKGAWSIKMAQLHPEWNFVAVEKLSNVIVVACEQAKTAGVTNLRFLNVRAEDLGWYLPPKSVRHIALNFSCPFPKKTYANRRLTSKNFLELYRTLLTDDGSVGLKTDNRPFFDWSIESFVDNGYIVFDTCYDLPEGVGVPTEYETKFRAKGLPIYALRARIQD